MCLRACIRAAAATTNLDTAQHAYKRNTPAPSPPTNQQTKPKQGAVKPLVEALKAAQKEKVVRVSLLALRNLLDAGAGALRLSSSRCNNQRRGTLIGWP